MNVPKSEAIERAALQDLHDAAGQDDIDNLGLKAVSVSSAFVSVARNLPASAIVINRTVGLGLSTAATRDDVKSIVSIYRDAGVSRFFVQLHPNAMPGELPRWLCEEGLVVGRGWQKFSRDDIGVEDRPTDLEVREIDSEHGIAFAGILCSAFDLGDGAIPWLSKLPGRADWHIFMSFDGGQPAGVGTLFVRDGIGWTDFAATSPNFRRRGSQGAVMSSRLNRARQLGCRIVGTCTGVSVPGDPQHSYNNILKAGFTEDYVRENYVPE